MKRSMAMRWCGLLLAGVLATGLLQPGQARAQGGSAVESVAVYEFGRQITFAAQVQSTVPVQQATLVIIDQAQGVSHVRPVSFTAGRSEFIFDTQQNKVRPFSQVSWYYQLTFTDGTTVQSPPQTLRYADNRFTWQTVEAGTLRLYWAQGDAAFGQAALNAALTGLQTIGALVPANLDQPIELYLYPQQSDIAFLAGEAWEAGRAYPDLGVALAVAEFDSNQSVTLERRIPHELMHILLYRQLGTGYQNLPVWLNEGLATLAETNPTPDYERALQDASARNALIPLRDLCASFPAEPASAFLAYAQARSFTTYLRDTYGAPALLNLARAYATGMDCDAGVQGVLVLSLAELDANWRTQALGQNALGAALGNIMPYLILLLVLIGVPLLAGAGKKK